MSTHTIKIGTTVDGKVMRLDSEALIAGRALITAASGGGKSYALRKLLEQCGQIAQTIVLDWEGEFASLREKLDIAIVGPGGEIAADVRSAGLLARRLMEKEISAVIDISEMKYGARKEFVRKFAEEMIELPKHLWHDVFIAIDEAHQLCPEKGQGESESTEAVINLCTLGRKRGFCTIAAVQRLSQLNKSAAAQLLTKLVGQANLDLDVKRAAFDLGVTVKEAQELLRPANKHRKELSEGLLPGEFYCYGPASPLPGLTRFTVAECETTHPKRGQGRNITPPKPSSTITAVVAELADLPKEAEAEIRDLNAAKKKIVELERELKRAVSIQPTAATPSKSEISTTVRPLQQQVKQLRQGLEIAMKVIAQIEAKGFDKTGVTAEEVEKALAAAKDQIVRLVEQKLARTAADYEKFREQARKALSQLQKLIDADVNVSVSVKHNDPFSVTSAPPRPAREARPGPAADIAGRHELTAVERDVLDAAASFPDGATRQRISIFSGRSIKSSSFNAAFSESEGAEKPSLIVRGLMRRDGDLYIATELGMPLAEPTAGTSLEDWLGKISGVEADVLRTIASAAPARMTRAEVSEKSGRSITSSSFTAAFGQLRDLGLIEGKSDFALTADLAEGL